MNDRREKVIAEVEDPYFGRMNDPTAAATLTGPCGDTMEVYLVVRDDVIEDVKYHRRVRQHAILRSCHRPAGVGAERDRCALDQRGRVDSLR